MKTISVVIVDDHPVIRRGVSSVLSKEADLEIVGEAHDAKSALKLIKKLHPEIIILDITLEGISGIDFIPKIKEHIEDANIVIYTMHQAPDQIHRAIKAGARGYVLKGDEIKDLITAVRDVQEGRLYLSKNIPAEIMEQILTGKGEGTAYSMLTPREYEVANLLAQGMNPDEVGNTLFISPKTVRVHRTNIMHKLGCGRVNELLLCLAKQFPY